MKSKKMKWSKRKFTLDEVLDGILLGALAVFVLIAAWLVTIQITAQKIAAILAAPAC